MYIHIHTYIHTIQQTIVLVFYFLFYLNNIYVITSLTGAITSFLLLYLIIVIRI